MTAAAGAAATAAGAAAEARLRRAAVRGEDRQLAQDVRTAAIRAVRLLAVPHELLEVRLARHARVFVDRHAPSLRPGATLASARYPLRNWSNDVRDDHRYRRRRACRLGNCRPPARTRSPAPRRGERPRAPLRAGRRDRRGRVARRAGAVGRARERSDAARSAGPARAPLQRPPAPDARLPAAAPSSSTARTRP